MRPIDADKLEAKCKEIIAQEREYGTATVSWAHAYESFLDLLETAPTLTADDYFDAVDRINPCPNRRYTLLGALTENVPRWIPVTDHMPEDDENIKFFEQGNLKFATVLVYGKETGVYMGNRINISPCGIPCIDVNATNGWEWSCGCKNTTHWMPLPEEPEEEK